MTRALGIITLALGLLGCKMDNPAFDLERETAAANGSDDAPINESSDDDPSGDGDGEPDDSSSESSSDTGECTPNTACGPCQVCDDLGDCVIDVGGACEGAAPLHCNDYLYGAEQSICYRLPDVTVPGSCTEQGICEPPSPSDCPHETGAVHFACDPACVTNVEGCTAFAMAAEVEMSAMCAVEGEGPDCKAVCSNEMGWAVKYYSCVMGECSLLDDFVQCGGYACDIESVECYESCTTDLQCAESFACSNGGCTQP